jgi:hypothetical protein
MGGEGRIGSWGNDAGRSEASKPGAGKGELT